MLGGFECIIASYNKVCSAESKQYYVQTKNFILMTCKLFVIHSGYIAKFAMQICTRMTCNVQMVHIYHTCLEVIFGSISKPPNNIHCITLFHAQHGICWKPGKTSKCRPIHSTIQIWTDFHENEAKKKIIFLEKKSKMAVFQKWPFFKIANSQNFFGNF